VLDNPPSRSAFQLITASNSQQRESILLLIANAQQSSRETDKSSGYFPSLYLEVDVMSQDMANNVAFVYLPKREIHNQQSNVFSSSRSSRSNDPNQLVAAIISRHSISPGTPRLSHLADDK